MFPISHSSSPLVEQESGSLNESPATNIGQEQRVRALEAEVKALQRLVCHLLERNESLRMAAANVNEERL
jgi:hypothetical protein